MTMDNAQLSSRSFQQQWRTLLIFMVVVGYLTTFAQGVEGGVYYSAGRLVVGVLLGIIYLIIGMFDTELLGRFSETAQNVLYFSIQCLLVLGIGMLLGPGGSWLIGLPLAGIAVERLSVRLRWVVYGAVILVIVAPIAFYSTLGTALLNAAIMSTAIFFVVLFTQLRLNEQDARIKAEELAHQLEVANHQLAEYASQAEELAATQERNRLAREIHDNLGHYLTIVNVQIEAAKVTFAADPARAYDALDKAQELAKKGLTSVRESVAALRVSPVENRRVENAITELIEESQATGIETVFKVVGTSKPVESKSALVLYRVVQEGLTNIRKHADASNVDVTLDFSQSDFIRLTLRDDGSGAADTSSGFGLVGLRERVHLLGGEFEIQTQPGQGFAIGVTLPLAEETTE